MNKLYLHSIFDKKLTYYSEYESFCYQNCLRILLESKGVDNSWLYVNSCASMYYINDLQFRSHNGVRGLIPSLSNSVVRIYEEDKSAELVFDENCEYISSNDEVIIVGVDTYYLPYASNYQKNHAKHTMIMCGYDLDNKLVYIIDWYAPWFFRGTISISDFLLARNSLNEYDNTLYSGSEIKNNWAHIKKFDFESYVPNFAIKEVIDESVKNYYSNAKFVGANGLKLFISDLIRQVATNYDKKKIISSYKNLLVLSKRHLFFLRYLINIKEYINIYLDELIIMQEEIIAKWDSFLMILLKISMISNEKTLNRLIDLCDCIVKMENKFTRKLNSLVKVL